VLYLRQSCAIVQLPVLCTLLHIAWLRSITDCSYALYWACRWCPVHKPLNTTALVTLTMALV